MSYIAVSGDIDRYEHCDDENYQVRTGTIRRPHRLPSRSGICYALSSGIILFYK